MKRPSYERQWNLDAEREIAGEFASAAGCGCVKLKKFYPLDYAFVRGDRVVGWGECKERSNASTRYSSYMISLDKVRNLIAMRRDTGLPAILLVRWTDATLVYTPTTMHFPPILMGGRADRDDPGDIEPVCHIPMTEFRNVQEVAYGWRKGG